MPTVAAITRSRETSRGRVVKLLDLFGELEDRATTTDLIRLVVRRAARDDAVEVSAFVTLLIQSDALGTSIAQTLRVYADEMRVKRMMRAEEMAHKLPVKLVIPLVTCILPAMLTAVLLPAIIEIVRNIMPHLGN